MKETQRLIYDVGINDRPDILTCYVDEHGKTHHDPRYVRWNNLIQRCHSSVFKARGPTYTECTVYDEWLYFSNFVKWLDKQQNWEGKELDKDIIIPGNKFYSPETCCFVSCADNLLLSSNSAARGKYPQGVSWFKRVNKFVSKISINGKRKYLGTFATESEASAVYVKAKTELIREVAYRQSDKRVRDGFLRHADLLINSANKNLL